MAQLVTCPQCDNELFVADGVATGSWARCPSCQAFFQLRDAKVRELATLDVVEPAAAPPVAHEKSVVHDEPLVAQHDSATVESVEPPVSFDEPTTAYSEPASEFSFDDLLSSITDSGESHSEESHDQEHASEHAAADMTAYEQSAADQAEDAYADDVEDLSHVGDDSPAIQAFTDTSIDLTASDDEELSVEDDELSTEESEPFDFDSVLSDDAEVETEAKTPKLTESAEAAAERIDAWFRSAKTLPDVPPLPGEQHELSESAAAAFAGLQPSASHDDEMRLRLHDGEHDEQEHDEDKFVSGAATSATIDLGSHGIGGMALNDDFELDTAEDAPKSGPAWDDAQHMDRLLAELQDQPRDEYVPTYEDTPGDEGSELAGAAAEWAPSEGHSLVPPADASQSKRSLARTLVMAVLGGLMGLPLGYYALMWIGVSFLHRGPEIDYLQIAKYLPKAMLPAAFNKPEHKVVATPAPPAPPAVEDNAAPPVAPADGAANEAKTADAAPATTEAKTTESNVAATPDAPPAEKVASLTEPAAKDQPAETKSEVIPASATTPVIEKPAEPSLFDAPAATAVKEATPTVEPIRITGAPTFTAADLSDSIVASKTAVADLVDGNLNDNREVARTKGASYMILADLAQKSLFVDPTSPDAAKEQEAADEILRGALATPHAREEIGQIVPKWMASPNRRIGGVFFGGTVIGHDAKGSMTECSILAGGGQPLPVLVPAAIGEQIKASPKPVGVVGWIVDQPAEHVPGYTGNAPQAVYAAKLLPLD